MIAQALMDGLIAGTMIGLGAIGITLTYSILRFANFAHGELISWGAYAALGVSGALATLWAPLSTPIGPFSFGWSLPLGLLASMLLTGLLALLVDLLLFGRLRARKSAVIILVMAGFGAALTMRSLLEFLVTSKPAYFTSALQIAMKIAPGVRATPDQLLSLAVSALLVFAVHLLLTRTAIGRAMRAVSENQQLAALAGVDVRRTIQIVWLLGAALAAVLGLTVGATVAVEVPPQAARNAPTAEAERPSAAARRRKSRRFTRPDALPGKLVIWVSFALFLPATDDSGGGFRYRS